MYSLNSIKDGWLDKVWDEVNLILWGSSIKLSVEDEEVQTELKKMVENGVSVVACKKCADKMKASNTLKDLGVEVKYIKTLTEIEMKKEHYFII